MDQLAKPSAIGVKRRRKINSWLRMIIAGRISGNVLLFSRRAKQATSLGYLITLSADEACFRTAFICKIAPLRMLIGAGSNAICR
jgi:hypothetical protein